MFAKATEESVNAPTFEPVDEIVTGAGVLARARRALVDVVRTVASGKSRRAEADEVVDQLTADGSVGAGTVEAFVHIILAEESDEARETTTLEVVDLVDARPAVEARIYIAFVGIRLAVVTVETRWTQALVSVAAVNARTTCQQKRMGVSASILACKQVVKGTDLAALVCCLRRRSSEFVSFYGSIVGISCFPRNARIDSISR